MTETQRFRLRLKLAGGQELEAEGSPDFVKGERKAFLESLREPAPTTPQGPSDRGFQPPDWDQITETKAGNLQLRAKLRGERTEKDACLVLLAAAHKLLHASKPTASQLARWLRSSGYPVSRVDRALAEALQKGEILASGARRARRYELTGPGRAKAFLVAHELTRQVAGKPD